MIPMSPVLADGKAADSVLAINEDGMKGPFGKGPVTKLVDGCTHVLPDGMTKPVPLM